jgi:hypothetical protein
MWLSIHGKLLTARDGFFFRGLELRSGMAAKQADEPTALLQRQARSPSGKGWVVMHIPSILMQCYFRKKRDLFPTN